MEIRSNSFDPAQRPPAQADFTRPNRDTIERGTPEPVTGEDIRARLARQRHETAEKAERAKAARAKHEEGEKSQRAHAARGRHEAAEKANRIRMARMRASGQDGDGATRPARADSVQIGSSQSEQAASVQESLIAQRAHAARGRHEAAETHQRAMAARDRLSLSETTLRLQADVAPAGNSSSERVAELRALHQAGALNTEELIARAAFKLLSGE